MYIYRYIYIIRAVGLGLLVLALVCRADALAACAGSQPITASTALLLLILDYCRQSWHSAGCTMAAQAF